MTVCMWWDFLYGKAAKATTTYKDTNRRVIQELQVLIDPLLEDSFFH